MKKKIWLLLTLLFTNVAFAAPADLDQQRRDVLNTYVSDLGAGAFQAIPALFTKDGVVVRAGTPDSPEHFYGTFMASTHFNTSTSLLNVFPGQMNKDANMIYFNFKWDNEDHVANEKNFIDLIVFEPETALIQKLIIMGPYTI